MVTKKLPLSDRQTRYLADAQAIFNEAATEARRAQAELSRIIDLCLDANGLPENTQVGNLHLAEQYLEVITPDPVESNNAEVSK